MLSFNPYSIGFYSLIEDKPNQFIINYTFQSLFYWILFSYVPDATVTTVKNDVSILILLDSILLFILQRPYLT